MEPVGGLGIFLIVEPIRECEVPEADDRLDAGGLESAGHLDIAVQCLLVELAHARLDARPLEAEPIMTDACFLEGREVFIEVGPGIKSVAFLGSATL